MFYLYPPLYSIFLTLPGGGVIQSGIDTASNSVHLEINRILAAIILVLVAILICLVKYFIKDKKEALKALREDMAKEQAINEGAHQSMIATKNDHIKYIQAENEDLKQKYTMIIRDNTEGFKQVATKIGSFVEGQAVVAANQEKNKSDILLEINRLFSNLRST